MSCGSWRVDRKFLLNHTGIVRRNLSLRRRAHHIRQLNQERIGPRRRWWSPGLLWSAASSGQFVFAEFHRDHNTLFKPLTVKRTAELSFEAASNEFAPKASTAVGCRNGWAAPLSPNNEEITPVRGG